jgi:hypothetical protein
MNEPLPAGITFEHVIVSTNCYSGHHTEVWGDRYFFEGGDDEGYEDLEDAIAAMQDAAETWHDWHEGDTVPACDRVDVIRVDAGIKGATESQIDNVVTTSQYWGPNSFVRMWRPAVAKPAAADPNAKMVDRDSSGVVSCAREQSDREWMRDHEERVAALVATARNFARRARNERVSAAAWTEHQPDHRLGNFN